MHWHVDHIHTQVGAILLEFGAHDCPYCQAVQATITAAIKEFPNIRHIQVEDGKGKRLGRLFHVKRWPTLVFLKEGVEVARLVREVNAAALQNALKQITQ